MGETGKTIAGILAVVLGICSGFYVGLMFYNHQVYGVNTSQHASIAIGVITAVMVAFLLYRGVHPR